MKLCIQTYLGGYCLYDEIKLEQVLMYNYYCSYTKLIAASYPIYITLYTIK